MHDNKARRPLPKRIKKKAPRPRRMPYHSEIYADFNERRANSSDDKYIYVGGPYYQDHAQIHLTREQAEKMAAWFHKLHLYFEDQKARQK